MIKCCKKVIKQTEKEENDAGRYPHNTKSKHRERKSMEDLKCSFCSQFFPNITV
jgi:hypothetical protein